ncbi:MULTISPECIES: hypothetical protein [unclassified Streptomyces]|uniref:hypothetical protein n=1 Tax=unclassified Streptomyces TaxID=2593676 RepID=UPI000AF55F73|nr:MULTISPECIES: hypothetical protein [unclassified Streptomyces]
MQSADLMGGYAAYTSPRTAVEELATTRNQHDDAEASPWIVTTISLVVTILLPLTAS